MAAVERAVAMVVVVRAVAATEEARAAARAVAARAVAARVAHLPLDESHARVARAVLRVVRHTVRGAGTG